MKTYRIICLVLILCLPFLLSSCIAREDVRPQPDSNYVWVCEEPFSYFVFDEINYNAPGIIVYKENEYRYFMVDYSGTTVRFVLSSAFSEDGHTPDGNTWLLGTADYQEGYFVYTIKEDYFNIFDGEVETMTFVRMSKEEFEEKYGSVIEFETAAEQTIWD